jgi:hypothetical protein
MDNLTELRTLLDERFEEYDSRWTNYIIAYRQQANQTVQNPGNAGIGNIMPSLVTGGNVAGTVGNTDGKIKSLFDLVGGQGSPFADDPSEMNEYMPVLYDNLMTSDTPIAGRININQASRTVLELFAVHDDESTDNDTASSTATEASTGTTFSQTDMWDIVDQIVTMRISDPYLMDSLEMKYPFWIYTHGIITDLAEMKRLEPYFCAQGAVFKATVVGRFDERSPVSRLEVWLDAAEEGRLPKIIRIRDISELGPGYSAELLGADMYVR